MESRPTDLDSIRRQACEFLKNDDWQLTQTAERDGYRLGYNQCQIIELLLARLEEDCDFHEVPLGEPPGSMGVGYVLNDADGRGLYVKFVLEWQYLKVVSFHINKHYRSD